MDGCWKDIRQEVCTTCIDGDPHGRCHLPVDEACVLRDQLEVVQNAVREYTGRAGRREMVRETVCRACGTRETDGSCWRANRLECAFDRMLPAIIEHMETWQARQA